MTDNRSHRVRRNKEEEEEGREGWTISPQIYAIIFDENAKVLNIYCQ
ncbi:MAG: hypothetical protein HCA25_11630 [Dolichospermum sp. DET50]|nr:hypothetical protein [Dolichospermum sp. DET66]MBS3032904.1 hypothetical protein [Dolichospermum sp. DET67]MBS3038109.1 hypothetical protein [Dolichospermum sp. DET50]QSX70014.1 MAG: hypothetical protein EZY12_10845 [Dolichospermum sp. DET69]